MIFINGKQFMLTETNYKVKFCEKYFNKDLCEYEIDKIDILLKNRNDEILLYIESKSKLTTDAELKKALAQAVLTNKKQEKILSHIAVIYKDGTDNDNLMLIDCSSDDVMYNNDINWVSETPSKPSQDAIDRINDRIKYKTVLYQNEQIKDFYKILLDNNLTTIDITYKNMVVVYNDWKCNVLFSRENINEQDLINLFLVDILNGTVYTQIVKEEILGETRKVEYPLIKESTCLNKYEFIRLIDYNSYQFQYADRDIYKISDTKKYDNFWLKYKRSPSKEEFIKILEHSAELYTDRYRKDTGGEYTPICFAKLQNEILKKNGYNLNDYIIVDPCAGVGNLENLFEKDFKKNCYLSTLERTDVDICKIKGFENSVQFDFLKEKEEYPKWLYKGELLSVKEICKKENKKLMYILNPPYNRSGKDNKAIRFFDKVVNDQPDVIVFYYMTESFLRNERNHYIASNYKIKKHIMSNAQTTFLLSQWPISLVIFDKNEGVEIDNKVVEVERYELDKSNSLIYKQTLQYDLERENLIEEINEKIKLNKTGYQLGHFSFIKGTINLDNKDYESNDKITTDNLKYCLLSKGLNFNTHNKYYERNQYVYKGKVEDIPDELFNDAIAFSLFYVNCAFSNKLCNNYIMPFSSKELGNGCTQNSLNILCYHSEDLLDYKKEQYFDFRTWLKQFNFSKEAKNLFAAALEIFKYYHSNEKFKDIRNFNDSFYDITNAIMEKNNSNFCRLDKSNDTRITKVKTTKDTTGFGRKTYKSKVPEEYHQIFEDFFDARDKLAKKINKQLVDSGLLLWERENIY